MDLLDKLILFSIELEIHLIGVYIVQIKKIFIVLFVAIVSVGSLQAKRTVVKFANYVVEPGDTLFIIARKYHTTTEEVRQSNGLAKNELIRVGQQLRVPTDTYFPSKKSSAKAKKAPEKGIAEYTVEAGDTLFIIARKHHTTIREVREANEMKPNALIRIGQQLKVPQNTYFPERKKSELTEKEGVAKKGKTTYIIERGDTVFTVAKKHHTTVKEVLEANGIDRSTLIRVGQTLTVPVNTYFPERGAAEKNPKKVATKKASRELKGFYEVQSGDTLFSIARKNHVTLKEIMSLNDIKPGSVIRVGQKLKVSKKGTFIAKKSQKVKTRKVWEMYKVKRGDTLSRIAHRHKISIKQLKALNNIKKTRYLKVGESLAVGERKVKKKQVTTYRVKRGDTLWLIAKKNHTTVKKLRALNHLSRRSKLHRGMTLAVRGKVSALRKSAPKVKKTTRIASSTKKKRSQKQRRNNALAVFSGQSKRGSRGSSRVIKTAKRYLGTRYVWGAEGPNRFDCSGFTQYVIRKSKGVRLPRVSRKQAYYGKYVSRRNLRAGDLIFFDTSRRRRGYVNHVGIYIGSNKFIHASSAKHRVVISSLNRPFYNARFKWGRRVN